MSKHTPGPWTIGVYRTTAEFREHEEHVAVMKADDQMLLAITGPTLDAASVADARLIAAAPELLELLKALHDKGVYGLGDQGQRLYNRVVRVIAKAEVAVKSEGVDDESTTHN
jgi:type VI protein secretion system component VasF